MPDVLPPIAAKGGGAGGTLVSSGQQVAAPTPAKAGGGGARGFPKITIKNQRGDVINTDSTYQDAINEARYRLAQGEHPTEPSEWRLPHSRLPARPDYSRAAPPAAVVRQYKSEKQRRNRRLHKSLPNFVEALQREYDEQIPDLSFSLAQLESLPPIVAATLVHSHLTRPREREYLNLLGNTPLTDREFSETEKREAEYTFPGFCYGCRGGEPMVYLCYGCERDPNPHYHQDKPARTGGGFTYIKRDKAEHELVKNNPLYWKVMADPNQYVFYDKGWDELEKYGLTPAVGKPAYKLRVIPEAYPSGHTAISEGEEGVESDEFGARLHVLSPVSDLDSGKGATVDGSQDHGTHRSDRYSDFGVQGKGTDDSSSVGLGMNISARGAGEGQGQTKLPALEEQRESSNLSRRSGTAADQDGVGDKEATRSSLDSKDSGRRGKLYKAPKAFSLKKTDRKVTEAKDPFSTDREYDIPKGDGFEIKKSDKELTKFDEFKMGEHEWQEPDRFELKEGDHKTTEHWQPTLKEKEKSRRRSSHEEDVKLPRVPQSSSKESESSDSGVDSVPAITDVKKEVREPSITEETEVKETGEPVEPQSTEEEVKPPVLEETEKEEREEEKGEGEVKEKKKREVVKKEKKEPGERKRPQKKDEEETKEPSAVSVAEEEEPESAPLELPPMPDLSIPRPKPVRRVEPPPLPRAQPPAPPKLQQYRSPEKPKRELAVTLIESPPPMPEPPKQRRPPPSRKPKKTRERRKPPLVTSVTPQVAKETAKELGDPFDYLAKYCIIHPDRLPHYERIFYQVIGEQVYRYADVPHPDGAFSTDENKREITKVPELDANGQPKQKTRLTEHERRMIDDFAVVNRATKAEFARGQNEGDQQVALISFTLDTLIDKYEHLQDKLDTLMLQRNKVVAEMGRKSFPEITRRDYKPKKPKQKKKKKKKSKDGKETTAPEVVNPEAAGAVSGAESGAEQDKQPGILTDIDIIMRMDKKMLEAVETDDGVRRLNLEIDRVQEKLKDVDDRIEALEDEKKLMLLYARDRYFEDKFADGPKSEDWLRPQSALYKKMHPHPNAEMNLSELEDALQQLNSHLLTERELQYVYHVLDLPGRMRRRRIDVQLFSVVAALSEKIRQVDPLIRKLINKLDFEALSVKMERSKELFGLLSEEEGLAAPSGKITAGSLGVELVAGGVSAEHTQYVVNKFNREKKGVVDFLDFLTYVPLFIEMHERIIGDPLCDDRIM